MSTFRFVAVKLCFCLIIGILIGNYFDPGIWKSIFITSLLIVLLLLQFQKSTRVINFGLLALLTTVSVGVLSVSLANPLNYKSFYGYHAGEEDETWVLKIRETLKNSPFANRYYAETLKNSQLKLSGKMLLEAGINDSIPVFQVDDLILLRGKPLMISPPLNPGDFDYRQYLKNLGIHYRIRLDKEKLVYHENGQKTLYGLANHIKNNLLAKLSDTHLEPEVRAIIQALLLGHRDDISSETFGYYKDSGRSISWPFRVYTLGFYCFFYAF